MAEKSLGRRSNKEGSNYKVILGEKQVIDAVDEGVTGMKVGETEVIRSPIVEQTYSVSCRFIEGLNIGLQDRVGRDSEK